MRGLVKDGARQLRKAGLVGVVALSLDRLFAPNDQRIAADSPEGLKPAAPQIVIDTVRPHLPALDRDAGSSPALAVLAFVVVPAVVARDNNIGRVEAILLHGLKQTTEKQAAALLLLLDALGDSSVL